MDADQGWGLLTRSAIFEALGSFDIQGMTPEEAARETLSLLKEESEDPDAFYQAFLAREPVEPFEPLGEVDIAECDALLENIFNFYGEIHDLGADIDWEHNPGTDHWGHDLNRFAFLRPLVSATLQAGDERYVRKAADLVLDWVRKNEVCDAREWDGNTERSPYVWRSYLNTAVHLGRWTDVIDNLAPFWTPVELLSVLKSIHDQLGWLLRVVPLRTNNWVVIGSTGIIETTVRLPELKASDRLIDAAWGFIEHEAENEVLADGMQFELTQSYHMCVLTRFSRCLEICRKAGRDVSAGLDATVQHMTDYTMQIITPDGKSVAFNDGDPRSGESFCKFLVKTGRQYDRADWVYVGTGGQEGTVPAVTSQAFDHGGVYVMRTGWDREAVFLAFDGGPWGKSHQHDDRLSFWLSAYGRSLVVDPGRYLYDKNNPYSPYLRTSHAHSTITVDDATQADGYFRELSVPGPRLDRNVWVDRDGFNQVAGEHTLGYGENGRIKVVHRRGVLFWHPNVFLIVDRLTGDGTHEIASRLQFAPTDVVCSDGVWHTTHDDANLALIPWVNGKFDVSVEKGRLEPHVAGWYSDNVNQIEPSPTLVVKANATPSLTAGFLLVAYRGQKVPVVSLEAKDDAFTVHAGQIVQEVPWDKALGYGAS